MLDEQFNDISNPIHYDGDGVVQCKRAMSSMMSVAPLWLSHESAYWWCCAFKYLWRWPHKNKIKDLMKAKQCIDYLIDKATKDITEWSTANEKEKAESLSGQEYSKIKDTLLQEECSTKADQNHLMSPDSPEFIRKSSVPTHFGCIRP